MDVVGDEDSIDMKTNEVYRPSVLSIRKSEYEVSLVIKCMCMCVCVCVHARMCVCATLCLEKHPFLVSTGAQVKYQHVDI